jgi:spore coat protein U-like protein
MERRMSIARWRLAAATAVLALAAPASAGTNTYQLTVTAAVQAGCGLAGGTLDFGVYVPGQPDALDAVGQIRFVSCLGELTIELDGGRNGSVSARRLASGTDRLAYQLYRDSGRTAVWGVGAEAVSVRLFTLQSGSVDVYGRIPGGVRSIADGEYADTINITMTF